MTIDRAATRKYKHPPVAEAVCEFVFVTSDDWDPTIPGRLYERIRDAYPSRPRTQQTLEAQLSAPEGNQIQVKQIAKVLLSDGDGTRMVGIGPNSLTVHTTVRPYLGWEEAFQPQIWEVVNSLSELGTSPPVQRVGVRYVNALAPVADIVAARRLLRTLPPSVDGLPTSPSSFFARVEYGYDQGTKLLMTTAKAETPEQSLILDIDVLREAIQPALQLKEALLVVNALKHRLSDAFESVITDEARELFDSN